MALRFIESRDRWEVAIAVRGKRIRRTFKKKNEAQEFLRDIRLKNLGFDGITKPYTVRDIFQTFLEIDSKQKTEASEKADRRSFEIMIFFFEKVRGLRMANEIRAEDLERFLIWAREARECENFSKSIWNDSTLARQAILLKTVLKRAMAWGKIGKNPASAWRIHGAESAKRRSMTSEEFEKLCAVSPPWFLEVVRFHRLTGARGASTASLRWSDVNFSTATLYLRSRKGGRNREKLVPFPMYHALHNFIASQKMNQREGEFVFTDEDGRPLSAAKIARFGHRMIKKAGLKGVVLYGLRHALATELTAAGVPTEVVRQALGHSSIRTTQDYAKGIAPTVVGKSLEQIRNDAVNALDKVAETLLGPAIDALNEMYLNGLPQDAAGKSNEFIEVESIRIVEDESKEVK
jgi:integrase